MTARYTFRPFLSVSADFLFLVRWYSFSKNVDKFGPVAVTKVDPPRRERERKREARAMLWDPGDRMSLDDTLASLSEKHRPADSKLQTRAEGKRC